MLSVPFTPKWLTSSLPSVATAWQKVFPMRFTKYFNQCLEDLETAPDYELDALLVNLVKVQHLTEKIHNWTCREDEDEDVPGFPRAPASAYHAAFYGDIVRLQASLPVNLRDDGRSPVWHVTLMFWTKTNDRFVLIVLLRVYFTFATLHLNEPPPVDAAVLRKLADSLTDVNRSTPSALDVFYRAQSALQDFFESWFEIPPNMYPGMPIFIMMQVVYSITMLARWAKILGPGQTPRRWNAPPDILTSQKFMWHPATTKPVPLTLFGAGLAPVPSFSTDSSNAATTTSDTMGAETQTTSSTASAQGQPSRVDIRLGKTSTHIRNPSQIPASQFRESADPTIPSVVASLKAKLLTQPGLNIDIIGILSTLAQRCEKVHKELTEKGEGGDWNNDIWYLCKKRILITRAKLEKWAEIIASGGTPTSAGPAADGVAAPQADQAQGEREEDMGDAGGAGVRLTEAQAQAKTQAQAGHGHPVPVQDGDFLAAFQRQIETAGQDILAPNPMGDDEWQNGDVWTDDMFDQLDPSLWLNDGSDWSMALLGSYQESQPGM